ncbi:MAG: DNA adenine methylase [Spirochaetales bacterium]|nr:DNA adenine methylase [Spirochaetales bacterium]
MPRLEPVFRRISSGYTEPRFLDAFAGSGAVSRLARAMGLAVFANDLEPYSEAINACWLGLAETDIRMAFGGRTGLSEFLAEWNSMHPLSLAERVPDSATGAPYIARWYAPVNTDAPKLGVERLFYTAENAVFIDRVRTRIEHDYPDPAPGSLEATRRTVLLGALLLEAAVHANTSGVFKAYHRGFGGNGKDALSRILGRMTLESPILPEGNRATVTRRDAKEFLLTPPVRLAGYDSSRRVGGESVDIAYFDPPYNQHQYGSNYHLLNTILRWDGEPAPMTTGADARFSVKAGIPESWKATRSRFCVKAKARDAIASLLDEIDAGTIIFSWSVDGHISGDDMIELLGSRGRLEVIALDYVAYRGGRQSSSRTSRSTEFLFSVDTSLDSVPASVSRRQLASAVALDAALRSVYNPQAVMAAFGFKPEAAEPAGALNMPGSLEAAFFTNDLRRASSSAVEILGAMDATMKERFLVKVASCACGDVVDELSVLLKIARQEVAAGNAKLAHKHSREAVRLIRKLAHGKYAFEFRRCIDEFGALAQAGGDTILQRNLDELVRLFAARQKKSQA